MPTTTTSKLDDQATTLPLAQAVLLLVDFSNLAIGAGRRSGSPPAMVRRVLRRTAEAACFVRATHVALAFDENRPSSRYAGRADESRHAVARRLLVELGYPVYQIPGEPADDVLLSVSVAAETAGFGRVIVLSGDRGLALAVGGGRAWLRVWHTHGRTQFVLSSARPRADALGGETGELDDYLVLGTRLMTDRGKPAVLDGRTAASLLRRFGSLDALLTRLAEIESSGLRARLELMRPELARRRDRLYRRRHLPLGLAPTSSGRLGALQPQSGGGSGLATDDPGLTALAAASLYWAAPHRRLTHRRKERSALARLRDTSLPSGG